MLCPSPLSRQPSENFVGSVLEISDTHSALVCCTINSTFKKSISRKRGENDLLSSALCGIYYL